MYIRKVKSRGSTCFQIGYKHYGKFVLTKHVGCASSFPLIEALRIKAQKELERFKFLNQLSLWPNISKPEIKAQLLDWKITGFHRFFGPIYDSVGFPKNFLKDLVIVRIVYPKSKLATARYMTRTLGIPTTKDKIYRFMDTMSKKKLTKTAYNFVSKKNKGISLIFYDVTTLYFETDKEDNCRQKGFSKEHRHDMPQILIGLFVDKDGYPFDYDFFKGKTFEGHTFPKAVKNIIRKYRFESLTVVADAGMLSKENLDFLVSLELNYIVGARLKNLTNKLTENLHSHNFNSKPFYQIKHNKKRLVVHFSQKRAKKHRANRKRIIEKLKLKLALNRTVIYKSKYLSVDKPGKAVGIDQDKIKADSKFDGLKGYFTNTSLPARTIIKQYRNLWQVKKAFRTACQKAI